MVSAAAAASVADVAAVSAASTLATVAAAALRPFVVVVLAFTLTLADDVVVVVVVCLRDFFAGGSCAAPAEVDCVGSDVVASEANATLAAQFAAVLPSGFFVSDLERFSPVEVVDVVAVAAVVAAVVNKGDGIAGA